MDTKTAFTLAVLMIELAAIMFIHLCSTAEKPYNHEGMIRGHRNISEKA